MFWFRSQPPKFTAKHKQLLKDTVIDPDAGPGTILRDFEALLDYLREQELQATPGHQLPLRSLQAINSRLTHPIELGLQRPQQKAYPPIAGLYLLTRASGLVYVDGIDKKPRLVVDKDLYQAWRDLSPSERYAILLETWLLRATTEILGERNRLFSIQENFGAWGDFFGRIPARGLQIAGNPDVERWLRYRPGWHHLGLSWLFGLLVKTASPQPGQGWHVDRAKRTPFGDALLACLYFDFFSDWDNVVRFDAAQEPSIGALQPALQPYFSEWQNHLPVPEGSFREGIHLFKVALGSVWRRIAIAAEDTLDVLARTILNSVDFDHDHLYEFSFQSRYGTRTEVHHPYMDEGPWTDEMRIGELSLRIGETMTFLFDFGDNWQFTVMLEEVDPELAIEGSTILEEHGEAPEQYPNWEEWE